MTIERVNPEAINRLDRFWEALLGNADGGGVVEPEAAATVRRLYALDDVTGPDRSFVQGLELELVAAGLASEGGRTHRSAPTKQFLQAGDLASSVAVERTRRRSRKSLEVAAAILLFVLVGFAAYSAREMASTGGEATAGVSNAMQAPETASTRLVVSDAGGQTLLPLHPLTLEDERPGAGPLSTLATPSLGSDAIRQPPSFHASANGSTVIRIEYPGDRAAGPWQFEITVFNGQSGDVQLRFTHDAPSNGVYDRPILSADGTRLLIPNQRYDTAAAHGPYGWFVYDATNGHQITTVLIEAEPDVIGSLHSGRFFVDAAGTRLYRFDLVRKPASQQTNPGPVATVSVGATQTVQGEREVLQLVVQDLATGAEIGRLDLPSVWTNLNDQTGSAINPLSAMALSPDGEEFVLVHPDGAAVTVIDTDRLTIDRVVRLNSETRATASTSPATSGASSGTESFWSEAAFSPDGRRLFVSWSSARHEGAGQVSVRLQVIELAAEVIAADVTTLDTVSPMATVVGTGGFFRLSPDGQSLYVYGPSQTQPAGSGLSMDQQTWTLLRLNAETLAVEAEREFRGYRSVLMWASG